MWRGLGNQPVLGQTVIPIQPPPSAPAPRPSHRQRVERTLHTPVSVKAEYPKQIRHDFSACPFVAVSVRVEFSGNSAGAGTLVQFCLQGEERGIKWTGVTGELDSSFLPAAPVDWFV